MSGTLIAQAVTLVLQIFIARTYSDFDKGLLGVYGSVTTLVITVAALRFDLAVMLPKTDRSARVVHRLATRSILIVSLLTSLVLIGGGRWLTDHYHHSQELALWLMGAGVTVFCVAQAQNLRFWLTRKGRFGDIARVSVVNALAISSFQLLFGRIFHGGLTALMLGTILGQLIVVLVLARKTRDARIRQEGEPTLTQIAYRYRRMPLLNGPNALVDALRNTGINLLIGAVAIAALGQFQLAWNIMQVPVGLIVGSVGQVFLKKLSDTPRGMMRPLVVKTLRGAALGAAVPFLVLYIVSPWLFPFVFGAQWDEAGYYARALTPWLYMNVLTSPISNLFVITENQQRMLFFAILYCVVPLAWLRFSPFELITTVTVLGLLMAAMLLGMLILAVWTAREYDEG